jgi:hypothetical protein
MPQREKTTPPGPEMIEAVNEMLRRLETLSADPAIVGSCPELPGIVLHKIEATLLDREGAEYDEITKDFNRLRAEFLQALVVHPIGRGLALLAVGPEGVALMEAGRLPSSITDVGFARGQPARGRRESYNCHHVVPKSVRSMGSLANHPANLVVAKTTRRGRNQAENPHHFWHSLLLHPQLHDAPDQPFPVYIVQPLFPFYPPVSQGYRSADELRKKLASYGAPPLPEVWEKRILEFSKATKHRPYIVPKEYHEITQMFGDLFKKKNKDDTVNRVLRENLAQKAAELAADFLPAGAYLLGKQLPVDHKPKRLLPIIETPAELTTSVAKPAARKRGAKKIAHQNAANQVKSRRQAM